MLNQKFKPTQAIIRAAELVFATKAMVELVKPIVNEYETKILAEGKWKIRPEFADDFPADQLVITDRKRSYLMSEEDAAVFFQKCHEARRAAKLYVEREDNCPLAAAENNLLDAEKLLCMEMEPVTGVTKQQLLNAGMQKYKDYIDLTLRLLAQYCQKAPVILKRITA